MMCKNTSNSGSLPRAFASLAVMTAMLLLAGCGAVDPATSGAVDAAALPSTEKSLDPTTRFADPITTLAVPKWLSESGAGVEIEVPNPIQQADVEQQKAFARGLSAGAEKADLTTQHVRAVADFNGDGRADVLWQTNTGATYITTLNETTARCPTVSLGVQTDQIMGTGDFNGDGKADIVWRNMSTGAVRISLIDVAGGDAPSNVVGIKTWLSVGASPIALNVKLEGIGDFDGNGRADMLWRNQTTGRSVMSYHNPDGSVASWPVVSNFINPLITTALKVGDINGDGKDDIVWRNMSTGNVVISLMDGNTPTWRGITTSPMSPTIRLEAIGDFDNNGKADLLWRNTVTGRSLMSYHNDDGSVASWPVVSNFINPASTSVAGVGDTDGDGKADILWRNLSTGNSVLSKMDGNFPVWNGVSYSVCNGATAEKLPHSGVNATQCYAAGSDNVIPCTSKAVKQLNAQQDGHRISISPMSYSEVPRLNGGNYARTECVKDNVTGLVWEGKEASGSRANSGTYTNYDSTMRLQKLTGYTYTNPTQTDIDSVTNSVGYVNLVNNAALCNYTDWRIPTVDELETLLNSSASSLGNMETVNSLWFPNTRKFIFITATPAASGDPMAWVVNFGTNHVETSVRNFPYSLRLVRGERPSVPAANGSCPTWPTHQRFAISGAEVTDRHTGLTWARCSVGQTWDGNTCVGSPRAHTHEAALQAASEQTGWRLPSRRELFSLVDKACQNPAIDSTAFPATGSTAYWTSSPVMSSLAGNVGLSAYKSWMVAFDAGVVRDTVRSQELYPYNGNLNYGVKAVRLVRVSP